MARTKRTFRNFKKAVYNASKKYSFLRRFNGRFNESYLRAAYEQRQTAIECCNSMTEVT